MTNSSAHLKHFKLVNLDTHDALKGFGGVLAGWSVSGNLCKLRMSHIFIYNPNLMRYVRIKT